MKNIVDKLSALVFASLAIDAVIEATHAELPRVPWLFYIGGVAVWAGLRLTSHYLSEVPR